LPTTFALIPGAGGSAWFWHRVTPLLAATGAGVIPIGLPADDDAADLTTYADIVVESVAEVSGPLVLVGQSMGAFTVPIVATRVPTALIVLLNPMVPTAGESGGLGAPPACGGWWENTGQRAARIEYFARIGLFREDFDPIEDFFHDVPEAVRAEALSQPEPQQSDTPFDQPWPLERWPDVPTRVIAGSEDRLFPLEFQRRVVRERLGLEVDVMPGGHLMALSRPQELVDLLVDFAKYWRTA
jgi:pimeloyl-ACP methyl ester carboxylesterase